MKGGYFVELVWVETFTSKTTLFVVRYSSVGPFPRCSTAALCLMWSPEILFFFHAQRHLVPLVRFKTWRFDCGWWSMIEACVQSVSNTCPPARQPTPVGRWISTTATTLWLTVTQNDAKMILQRLDNLWFRPTFFFYNNNNKNLSLLSTLTF